GIRAENRTETHATAMPAGVAKGSDTGVGASFALNISLNNTLAEIEHGETVTGSAHDFLVSAESANTATTKAEAGAAGSTSVGGAIAIAVIENDTVARIGSGAGGTVALTGDLGAQATHSNTVTSTASGEAAGDDVGVGIALALNIVIDDTSAELARNFSGADDVSVNSTSLNATRAETKASAKGASSTEDGSKDGKESRDSEQETNAQSSYATSKSGTTKAPASDAQSGGLSEANSKSSGESGQSASEGGGTSVAASVAVNFLETHNTASVAPGVSINATGALDVAAISAVDAAAVGLATATNTDADTGVAAAVGLNIALAGNSASVGNGAQLTAGSIAVRAGTPDVDSKNPAYRNTFQARALAGAASSDTAVGGSISLNYLDLDTNATVGSNAGLHATAGKLEVSAVSHNEIQNIAGGAALSTEGGTGVGVAVAVNIVNGLDTNASIGNNTTATASGDASITATASLVPVVETLPVLGEIGLTSFAAGIAGSAGGTAVGGSGSVNVYLMDTHASVDDNASVTAGGSVTIEATDILHVFSAAGGLAATTGGSGVGIGID